MSTILSEKKTLSPWAKGGIGLGAGALLLVLVGLLFPTAAAFFPLVLSLIHISEPTRRS